MSDHSSNQPDLSSQFYGLNMSAQPFVPSVRAPTFQPGGAAGYNQMYGGQYAGGKCKIINKLGVGHAKSK